MTHEEFIRQLTAPMYVWRMARANPRQKGHQTRMTNAQRKMDDLVIARAEQIKKERDAQEF